MAKGKALLNALEKNYGVVIRKVAESSEELLRKGYRKLGQEAKNAILPVFQYIPGLAASQAVRNGAKKAFERATKDTYKVIMQPGMHLLKAKNGSGNFRGMAMNRLTKDRSFPELMKNKVQFKVSGAPQVALGIFSAMSYFTGQYFMREINKKLTVIDDGVHEILQLLIDLQINDLQAYGQELDDINKRALYYQRSPETLTAALQQLHAIQHQSQAIINLAQSKIVSTKSDFSFKDKSETIAKNIESIGGFLLHYHYAMHIYTTAVMLEMQLSEAFDPDELEAYRQQILRRTEEYKTVYAATSAEIQGYLDGCGVLNRHSIFDVLLIRRKQKLKANQQRAVQRYLSELEDMSTIDAPAQAIAQYIEATRNGIEIIHMNGEYYTNMPVQEMQPQNTDHVQACATATC